MTYEEYATAIEAIEPEPNTPEWRVFWQKNIELSQEVTFYEIDGQSYARLSYGKEERYAKYGPWPPDGSCHDCNVLAGQLHVPGCDVEECPKCHFQSISCGCDGEDEDEE